MKTIKLDGLRVQRRSDAEGSRGGKVIGHTSSGKPIYESHGHEAHKGMSWQEHAEAARLHHKESSKHQEKMGKLRREHSGTDKINAAGQVDHPEYKKASEKAKHHTKQYDAHLTTAALQKKWGQDAHGRVASRGADAYAHQVESEKADIIKSHFQQ